MAISWTRKEKKHAYTGGLENVEHILKDNQMPGDERLAWLYREIHQLDEIDRSVILLLLDGFSYREMAEILGIGESNVGVKINRIKKQLSAKIKNYEYDGI
jgi:RNA polymerase sigma-70 factor (ECF subfamily)